MNLRPLQTDDASWVLDLWNRAARCDPLTPTLLAEKIWQDDDMQQDLCLAASEGGMLVGFGFAVARQWPDGVRGHVKLLAVDPAWQSQGIGSQLLDELEARLASRAVSEIRVDEAAPNYLNPGLDPRYSRASGFFERRSYQQIGETFNLHADLMQRDFDTRDDEARLAGQGIVARRAERDDLATVAALIDDQWPAWQREVAAAFANSPISLHVAEHAGAIVGFAAFDTNNRGTGWFGPMATAHAHRGLGIGQVVLRRCLADLQRQGLSRAIIPWVGPVEFYARHCGAEIARVFHRYRKVLS